MSDASRAAYAAGVPFILGGIAQTSGPNNGSLIITGTFTIVGEGGEIVGDVANKVGRTTGWTQGIITNTCVNTGVSGSNIVQLCQNFVSAGVGAGIPAQTCSWIRAQGSNSSACCGGGMGPARSSCTVPSRTSSRSWDRLRRSESHGRASPDARPSRGGSALIVFVASSQLTIVRRKYASFAM